MCCVHESGGFAEEERVDGREGVWGVRLDINHPPVGMCEQRKQASGGRT